MSFEAFPDGAQFAGQYKIIQQIGSGGSGFVYKAEHLVMNRLVALKILPQTILNDTEKKARFLNEVHTIASLDHPNIIKGFAAGVSDDGHPFIATEFFPGRDLADILQEEKHLQPRRLLEIILPVTEALDYAHQRHIIHRDLKPSNIMIDEAGNVMVIDFGIAKILADTNGVADNVKLTKTGIIIGSTKYISPEQINGKSVSAATDVYSLGILMFECLSGHPPYAGATDAQILYSHVHDTMPKLKICEPENFQAEAIEELIKKCLQKEPTQRFQSMSELRIALIESFEKRAPLLRKKTLAVWSVVLCVIGFIALRTAEISQKNKTQSIERQVKNPEAERPDLNHLRPKDRLNYLRNKRRKLDRTESASKLSDFEQILNEYDAVIHDLKKPGQEKQLFWAYFAKGMTAKKIIELLGTDKANEAAANKRGKEAIEDMQKAKNLATPHSAEALVATKELADSYDRLKSEENRQLAKENYLQALKLQDELDSEAFSTALNKQDDSNFEDSGTREIWMLRRLANIFREENDYSNAKKYFEKMYKKALGAEQPTDHGVFLGISEYIDLLLEHHEESKAKILLATMANSLKEDQDSKDKGLDALEIAILEHKAKDDKLVKVYLEQCKRWCQQNKAEPDAINNIDKIKSIEKKLYPSRFL